MKSAYLCYRYTNFFCPYFFGIFVLWKIFFGVWRFDISFVYFWQFKCSYKTRILNYPRNVAILFFQTQTEVFFPHFDINCVHMLDSLRYRGFLFHFFHDSFHTAFYINERKLSDRVATKKSDKHSLCYLAIQMSFWWSTKKNMKIRLSGFLTFEINLQRCSLYRHRKKPAVFSYLIGCWWKKLNVKKQNKI